MFRYLLLGLLRSGVPRHGYALMKAYRDRVGLRVNVGSFYRELRSLAEEGLICAVADDGAEDPRRAPYVITASGVERFDAWFTRPKPLPVARPDGELDARVVLIGDVDYGRTGRVTVVSPPPSGGGCL